MSANGETSIGDSLKIAGTILGILSAAIACLAYFFEQDLAAFIALFAACLIGIPYTTWVVLSRTAPQPSPIIGQVASQKTVPRFSHARRITAGLAVILQIGLLVLGSIHILAPVLESIVPATPNETLVVVSRLAGARNVSDPSLEIAAHLRQELKQSPVASLAGQLGNWRVELSRRVMTPEKASAIGKSLHALLVVTGHHDGRNVQIDVIIPPKTAGTDSSYRAELEVGLIGEPISLSGSIESLQPELTALALFVRGIQLYSLSDFHGAREALTQALSSSKNDRFKARITYMRGISGHALDDLGNAEEDFKAALGMGLESPELHWRLGEIYLRTDRLEDGDRAMQTALKRSGYSSAAYYRCGMTIFSWRRRIRFFTSDDPAMFKAADDYFRLALEKDQTNVRAAIARGELHLQFSQTHGSGFVLREAGIEVSQFLTTALEKNPSSGELRSFLSRVLFNSGKVEEAKALLADGIKKGGDRVGEFLVAMSIIHEQSNNRTEAIKYLNRLLEDHANRDGTWWERANARCALARLNGDRGVELFKIVGESQAAQRRAKFLEVIAWWHGRAWNRDFHGSRSTRDVVLFLLTEAGIIPTVSDRGSAEELLRSLLRKLDSRHWTPNVPVWFEAGIQAGGFFGITSEKENEFEGYYLEAGPNGKIATFDNPIVEVSDSFLYTVYEISMERTLAFNGD
jgi:tetratricopeptide (TPR) repeat protein